MSETPCHVCGFMPQADWGAGQLPFDGLRGRLLGLLLRLFFFIGAIKTTNTPTVMRRHREDIFYTTCTACKDFDRRDSSTAPAASLGMTITSSVTLSGASAESKGLEFAEHAPVRITMALDISPSRPLGCARGDKKTAERNLSAGLFIVYFSLGG